MRNMEINNNVVIINLILKESYKIIKHIIRNFFLFEKTACLRLQDLGEIHFSYCLFYSSSDMVIQNIQKKTKFLMYK